MLVDLPWAQDRAGEVRTIDSIRWKLGFQAESAMFGVGASRTARNGGIDRTARIKLHTGHVRPDGHLAATGRLGEHGRLGKAQGLVQNPVVVESVPAFQLQVFLEDGRGDGFGLSEVEWRLCDRLMIKRYEVVINGGEVICIDPKGVVQDVRTSWSAKVKVSMIGKANRCIGGGLGTVLD